MTAGAGVRHQGICCQVLGCDADLSAATAYCRKCRICPQHMKELAVLRKDRGSELFRFCQQCRCLHQLSHFEGDKMSCRAALLRRTRLYARASASDALVAATGSGSSTKTGARKKQRRQQQQQQQPQPLLASQLPEVLLLQPGTGLVAMSKRQLTALIAAGAVKQLSGAAGDSSSKVAAHNTSSSTAPPWVQQSALQLPQQVLPTCQQTLQPTASVCWQQAGNAAPGALPLSPACSPPAALPPAQQLLLATGSGVMAAGLTASCGGSGSNGSSSNNGGSSIGTYSCNSGSLSASGSFSRSSGSLSCSGGSLAGGSGCSPSIGSSGSGACTCSIASDATLSTSCSRAVGATRGAGAQGGVTWPLPVPELHTWTEQDVSELLADMVAAPGVPVDEMLRCMAQQQVM